MDQAALGLTDKGIVAPKPKPPPMSVDKGIVELVGSLCDPIVVYPGGWEDTLPQWIKQAVRIERLIENARAYKEGNITATDAEACAYCYTTFLCQVPSNDWVIIYQYLVSKTIRWQSKDAKVPEDLRVDKLTDYQERELAQLKRFIYNSRVKNRQLKSRAVRREMKEEEDARKKQEQPELPF